jgi:hypothetical protein
MITQKVINVSEIKDDAECPYNPENDTEIDKVDPIALYD